MTRNAYNKIAKGIAEATAFLNGEENGAVLYTVAVDTIDVAAARKRMGMSQDIFAATFGISAGTLRNWEQKRRRPEGPARALLQVIDREPEAVKRALAAR